MMTDNELIAALNDYAESVLARYIKATSPDNDIISKRKAYERYGRGYIDGLIADGRIEVHRQSSASNGKCYLSVADIERVKAEQSVTKLRWKNYYKTN